jgi:hypothetical protein
LGRRKPYHNTTVDYEAAIAAKSAPRWIRALKKYGYWPKPATTKQQSATAHERQTNCSLSYDPTLGCSNCSGWTPGPFQALLANGYALTRRDGSFVSEWQSNALRAIWVDLAIAYGLLSLES